MKEILAKRLKQVRESLGISQQDVANQLAIPRTAITQIESCNRMVSTLELTKLAGLYHRPISYFLNDDESNEDDIFSILYRSDSELLGQRNDLDRFACLCREGIFLEKLLGQKNDFSLPNYAEIGQKRLGEEIFRAESIAEQERRRLGIGFMPITNIADLIAEQGVWVSDENLPHAISGLFFHHQSIGTAILVNKHHSCERKRFSYAHEYAHTLFDRESTLKISKDNNAKELSEKRANAFAAAFLMPSEGVAHLLKNLNKGQPSRSKKIIFGGENEGRANSETEIRTKANAQKISCQDVVIVAYHFGVSYQAAIYRLLNLQYLSQQESKELLNQNDDGKSYLRMLNVSEESEVQANNQQSIFGLRQKVIYLAIEAYRSAEISRGKLFEIGKLADVSTEKMLDFAQLALAN